MATIAELLQAANRKIVHLEQIKTAMKSAINGSGSTVGDKFADYPPAVTNGRAGIAAAITEKGVQTAADAPFDVLEANVRAIETGGDMLTVSITASRTQVISYDGTTYSTGENFETLYGAVIILQRVGHAKITPTDAGVHVGYNGEADYYKILADCSVVAL